MSGSTPSERFVRELTRGQNTLFGFILSLAPDPDAARDILQDTNVVLWQKAEQFSEGTNFLVWAKAAARLQVLAYRRDHARDRHVFDEALLDRLAQERGPLADEPDDRARAFEDCLASLPPRQRELLARRYAPGGSVKEIARQRGQSPGAVSVTLSRIRKALADCILDKLSAEAFAS